MYEYAEGSAPNIDIGMTCCQTCPIREEAICASLDSIDREKLRKIGRRAHVPRGETLLWEGEDSSLVANVMSGMLQLSTSMADGREQILSVVYPADFIGRPFGHRTQHSVTALDDAQVCLFPRRAFDDFVRGHGELEHDLLERTLSELDRARRWMMLLGRKSAGERVATFLLEMTDRLGKAGRAVDGTKINYFDLPLTRGQVGDLLGLTIETVSRQLTRLRLAGLIALPDKRGVVILDRGALEVEAGND